MMAKPPPPEAPNNTFNERALWLRAAADALRDDFNKAGLPLPENIRFGFSTKGKGTQKTGECWHSPASADSTYEIFIRADQNEPLHILGILTRELVHAALPVEDSHGKRFKAAATRIGLIGKMREAVPGHLLESHLLSIAEALGPLPHAALDITWTPFDRKKPQKGRMLKAFCNGNNESVKSGQCGYTLRLSARWAEEYGAVCPKHGPMQISFVNSPE